MFANIKSMKKILLALLVMLGTLTLNAQVMYYVRTGENPKKGITECAVVYVNSDGSKIWYSQYTTVNQIRQNLVNNPNYYKDYGRSRVNNSNLEVGMMFKSKSYASFVSESGKCNLYKVDIYSNGSGIVSDRYMHTDYYAFSKDWNTFIRDPLNDDRATYFTRVDESVFQPAATNLDDLF